MVGVGRLANNLAPVARVLARSEQVSRFLAGVVEGWLPCFGPYLMEFGLSGALCSDDER